MSKEISLFYLTLHEWLMPWEDIILRIQSLLLWQKPLKSLLFTLIIHGCYWYMVWQQYNSLVVLSTVILIVHVIDFWKNYFWPLITAPLRYLPFIKWQQRSRRSVMWDTKGGRHLLTVHEICTHINTFVLRTGRLLNWIYQFRVEHRVMFFLISSASCFFTAYLGLYVYARTIFYTFLTSILLIPSASYHRLDAKFNQLISPWLARLDAELTARVQLECPKAAAAEELMFQPSMKDWAKAIEKEIAYSDPEEEGFTDNEDEIFMEQNFNITPNALLSVDDSSYSFSPVRDRKKLSLLDSAIIDDDDDDEWDLDQPTESSQTVPVLRHWSDRPTKNVLTSSDCLLDDDNGFEIVDCP